MQPPGEHAAPRARLADEQDRGVVWCHERECSLDVLEGGWRASIGMRGRGKQIHRSPGTARTMPSAAEGLPEGYNRPGVRPRRPGPSHNAQFAPRGSCSLRSKRRGGIDALPGRACASIVDSLKIVDEARPTRACATAGIRDAQAPCSTATPDPAETLMLDALFLTSTVGFFLLGLAYVRGCDRL